jgi:hypothetical protein
MTRCEEGAAMSITMDELPVAESAERLGRRPAPDSAVADAYTGARPDVGLLTSAAFALGMQAVGLVREQLFPTPEQMRLLSRAAGPHYTTYPDCDRFAGYGGHCNNPCFGYAPDHMSSYYCATCAEQAADPVNNPPWNWHFTGFRGHYQYEDNPSNPCLGRDAWKWKVEGRCGNCQQSSVFRCHDGYKKQPNSAVWENTICEGLISCDNHLTHC